MIVTPTTILNCGIELAVDRPTADDLTIRIGAGSISLGRGVRLANGATAIGSPATLTIAKIADGYIGTGETTVGAPATLIGAPILMGAPNGTAVNANVDRLMPTFSPTLILIDKNNPLSVSMLGAGESALSVSAYNGAILVATTTSDSNGSWSLPGLPLLDGVNDLSVKATDAAGNVEILTTHTTNVLSAGTTSVDATTTMHYVVLGSGILDVVAGGNASQGVTIGNGGVVSIGPGGTASCLILNGGVQFDYGSASYTFVESGGAQHVYHGGSAALTTVLAGGYQDVWNGAVTDTRLSGDQQVLTGGTSVRTVIESGARAYVASGGATVGTVIHAGGLQFMDAGSTSTNTIIDGGYECVGGTADATTVAGGGQQYVASGGTANGTHLVSGTEHVQAGGTAHDVDFAGSSGTLLLQSTSGLTGTISNFELGDTIDLLDTSVTSFDFDGSTLTLVTSGGSISYQFAGVEAGTEFNVGSDGHGGTAISLSLLSQFSASLVPEPGPDSTFSQDTTTTNPTLVSAQT